MNLIREYIKQLLAEQVCPFPKAIFMAGGPGSGKSTVLRNIGIINSMQVINPDDAYEESLKAAGIPLDRSEIFKKYKEVKEQYVSAVDSGDDDLARELEPEYLSLRGIMSQNMKLFNAARKAAKERQNDLSCQKQNFIVDGTGGNYRSIVKQSEVLKELGYEVAMIYVDVPLESSLDRNRERGKSGGRGLLDSEVEKSWTAVSKNLEPYTEYFKENLFYVDARESAFQDSIKQIKPKVLDFLSGN